MDLSPEALDEILNSLEGLLRERIVLYRPYAKQASFHAAGATHRERLLRAGNQNGKTFAGGAEMSYHLTGEYPDNWRGRRFDRPTVCWGSGVTGEATRDNAQRVLLGPVGGEIGTGTIPARCIVGKPASARGVADLVDYVLIRHRSGGTSTLRLKYYEQGRERWQGPPVDVVWFDEEPPEDIYDEGLARTIATGGLVYLTYTPLLGMSGITARFLLHPTADQHDTCMEIFDALHIPEAERARIIASFPAHEREARARGIPVLGSGRVFPVTEESIKVPAFEIPAHWCLIGGLDFGWDHPFAAALLAWDRDNDAVYVTNAYREREQTPIIHAAAVKPWGEWLPWAWPHDGLSTEKGSGTALKPQYEAQGLSLLPDKATMPDGTNSVEASILEMLTMMQTGRFKVFEHLADFWEEFRLFHRKDGKIVALRDDLISAVRYAVMMRRFAVQRPAPRLRARQANAGWMAG